MKVGTVFYNKVALPHTPIGTIGVCYEVYNGGISVIFSTNFYDGFAMRAEENEVRSMLKAIGFAEEIADFEFKNVIDLENRFLRKEFDSAFKNFERFNNHSLTPATFFYDLSFVDYDLI